MTINMNRTLAKRYRRGRRKKYNMSYEQVDDLNKVEDIDDVKIQGLASHAGSNKIWMTPPLNAVMGLKGGANKDIVEVEKVDRLVKLYTDWWMGIGFIDLGLVFTNDQDLT